MAGRDVRRHGFTERLGHNSVQITLDTYSHVLPTMQQREADLMGHLLGPEPPPGPNAGTMAVQEGSPDAADAV